MKIEELYIQATNTNKKAKKELFDILYASFRLILQYKGMNGQDAEDVIQDVMIVIDKGLKRIEKIENFSSWAHKVLKNKWLDYAKSRKYLKNKTPLELKDIYPARNNEIDFILMEQLIECFRKVGMINRRQARILNFHFQGYSTEEICARLEITKSNMYTLLSRARSALELCLEKGIHGHE